MAGFGGAIKNISIGIASAEGKTNIHTAGQGGSMWSAPQDPFLKSMAEAGKSVVDALDGNILYINVMNRLSVDCDCDSNEAEPELSEKDKYQNTILFPIGAPNDGFAQYFTGQSYLAPVSKEQVGIFNVTFEPGCRNNWHVHHADKGGGQILICVGGRGYYQEWGKEPKEMKPGDCINIPAGVKHWHGAAPDSWFSHLAVEVPGENGSNEWLEPVDEKQYGKLE